MKRIIILPVMLIVLFSSSAWGLEQVVRITLPSSDIRQECREIKIVPDRVVSPNQVEVVLTEAEVARIMSRGYPVEIIIPDYSKYLRQLFSQPDFAAYHNHAQTVAFVESLAQANPDIVRVDTLGYSVQGRVIQVMRITDNPDQDEFEPEVRFDGLHHGDETPASEVCLWLAKRLCEGYGSISYITSYVNNRDIWIAPMINPDGRESLTRYNANGIDLNREYGYMWDREGGSQYPFSQPESQALRSLMDSRNFTVAASYHTGTVQISQAWSYHYDRPYDHDAYNAVWSIYSAITGYPHEQGSHCMYYINGPTKDYDYGISGCIGSTVEVYSTKNPPANVLNGICTLNDSAMFEMIRVAGQGIAGYVTDSISGDPLWARITVIEKDWPIYTDQNFGDYHRYTLPGTYSIRVSAPGYQEKVISGITTYADTCTRVDVSLSPQDTSYGFRVVLCNVPNYNDQNHTVTPHSLGAPDGNFVSLGAASQSGQRNGWIILDMGPAHPVFNKSGFDLKVFEGNDGTTEACSVYVGNNPTWSGPWEFAGMVNGTGEIDISGTGLSQARYLMLVDDGDGSYSGSYPGYDLDGVVNYGRPQEASVSIVDYNFDPVLPYPGDSAELFLSLNNVGMANATNVNTVITSLTSGVTLYDSSYFISSLASGDTVDLPAFSMSFSAAMPLGTLVDIEVEITGSGEFTIMDTVSVFVGFQEFCDSVENGQGSWTHSGSNDLWHITTHKSHSPTHSWYCGNEGSWQYSNNMDASLVTPPVVIASGCVLEFWEWYEVESGWDYVHVEYSTDGSNWNSLRSLTGSNGSWQQSSLDLNSIPSGTTVQFRFRLYSDYMIVDEGWYVDDIRIYNPLGVEQPIGVNPPGEKLLIRPVMTLGSQQMIFEVSGVSPQNPGQLMIFDVSGRKIFETDLIQSGTYTWEQRAQQNPVSAGNYFAVVKNNDQRSYCKFIMF
ncbi:MAG: M14 family zinc carboxypeptidase [bacterium]